MKINGLCWKIFYDKNLGENYLGITDYFVLEIKINPIVKDKCNLDRTVTHEVIHAYLYSYGFTNKDKFKLDSSLNPTDILSIIKNSYLVFNIFLC